MASRGPNHTLVLLLLVLAAAGAGVLHLLGVDIWPLSDGAQGAARGVTEGEQPTLGADGEVGGLSAAPGSDPSAREARERARREAAARPTFPRSEGLFGVVTDGKGVPVPKATVRLFALDPQDVWRQHLLLDLAPLATATTADDGTYLVGPAPAGLLRLRAEAEGFAPTVQQVARRGGRVDLILDRGGGLAVRVIDDQGAAVVGARVVHTSGMVQTQGTTDAEGRAELPSLPTGQGALLVTKEGYGAARRGDVGVAPGGKESLTVVLGKPIALSGRVVAGETDRPVADAEVRITYPNFVAAEPPAPVTTGPDGDFRFEVVAPPGEQILLDASSPADGTGRTWLNVQDAGAGAMNAVVKVTATPLEIEGRVVDSRGGGVEGARVVVPQWSPGTPETPATTDADGRFTLPLPPGSSRGSWWQVVASHERLGMGASQGRVPAKPDERLEPVVIPLAGSGTVTGKVTGADGPVEGAIVALGVDWSLMRSGRGQPNPNWALMNALQDPRRTANLNAVTGPDGAFRLENVPAVSYRLTATHGSETASPADPVAVPADGTVEVEVTLGAGQTIEGIVTDEAGAPVAGAYVNAGQQGNQGNFGGRWLSARSQSDGTFTIRGVSDGSWTLHAWAAGYTSQPVQNLGPGTKGATVRLTALGWIEGVVYDGSRPYRGAFTVTAFFQPQGNQGGEGGWGNQNEQAYNTDDGRYAIKGLAAGTWLLTARTPEGRITREPVRADVMTGRGTVDVAIPLAIGATITGTLRNEETGRPVAQANLWANAKAGGGAPRPGSAAVTDGEGRFTIRGLSPGLYVLWVTPPSGISWQEDVDLQEGETRTLALLERTPGKVLVLVVDEEGRPLEGAQPVLTTPAGTVIWPSWQALQREGLVDLSRGGDPWGRVLRTGADGQNLRHHVPPGRYQVTAQFGNHTLVGEAPWVEVQAARTTEVTVVLKKAAPAPGR